jgi:tetratricopeptide (TPR) repeat protein
MALHAGISIDSKGVNRVGQSNMIGGSDDILMSFDPAKSELLRHNGGGGIMSGNSMSGSSRNDSSEAMELFSSASTHFQGHYNRGLVFLEHNDIDRALAEFEHAVRTEPGYPNAHNNYGVVLERRGNMAEAAREYEEAIRLQPLHRVACFNLANIKASLSHHAEAVTLYSTFLKRHPPSSIRLGGSSKGSGSGGGTTDNDNGEESSLPSDAPTGQWGEADQLGEDGESNYRPVDMAWLLPKDGHLGQKVVSNESSLTSGSSDGPSNGSGSSTGYTNSMEGMGLLAGPRPPSHRSTLQQHQRGIAARRAAAAASHVAPGTAAAISAAAAGHRTKTNRSSQGALSSAATAISSTSGVADSKVPASTSLDDSDDVLKKRTGTGGTKEAELSAGDEKVIQYLIPLALNNRAVCLTNQGQHQLALEGFNEALKLDGTLIFVKFNRAHLKMVLGDVHAALRDIRDVMRVRRNDYLNNFYAYCKRFQWALAVACKDYVNGLECLPVICDLNLRCPVNPTYMFNPFNLIDPLSSEFSLLERLLAAVTGDISHVQSVKLAKVMQDALSAQLVGNLRSAFQLLVEAGYLLPRHGVPIINNTPSSSLSSSSNSETKTAPTPSTIPGREYVGELKEIIALWRARIKV